LTSWLRRGLAVLIFPIALVSIPKASYRSALWDVVQVCVFDHQLTGSPFPCRRVDVSDGIGRGYIVFGAPFQRAHVVVVPTAPFRGIESRKLQEPGAPNYIQDAWESRVFVQQAATRRVTDRDVGLAVNSRKGRSQDQLHIHVACVRKSFMKDLVEYQGMVKTDAWVRLPFQFRRRRYWARRLESADFANSNVFALAASLLSVSPGALENLTFALLPTPAGEPAGFYMFTDQYTSDRRGSGHAEFLLNDTCSGD
jgi:CDP-diacylglycerol pyrophosphatase